MEGLACSRRREYSCVLHAPNLLRQLRDADAEPGILPIRPAYAGAAHYSHVAQAAEGGSRKAQQED